MNTMTTKTSKALKAWTHPTTGEVRIYCNDGQRAKVWIAADPETGYRVRYRADEMSDFGAGRFYAGAFQRAAEDIASCCCCAAGIDFQRTTWAEICAAAR